MKNPKRLGYLVPEFPTQTHAFFWREIQAIEALGVSATLFSTRQPQQGNCPHAFAEEAQNRTHYIFPPGLVGAISHILKHPKRTLAALKYVMSLSETPVLSRVKLLGLIPSAADLGVFCHNLGIRHIHIHSCANAAHVGVLTKILSEITYSLTLHGDLENYGTDHRSKMSGATFVSTVTRQLSNELREKISLKQPCPVIWMGVDTDLFRPELTSRTLEQSKRLEVVTVARLANTKGHGYFLRAMKTLHEEGLDIHYNIVGSGPFQPNIEAEIEELSLGDNVTLLGSLGERAVLELLKNCDVFVLPSINEAAPVAIMEAMSCGVPAICSVIGATPDMITNAHDGFLVPQKNVEAIVTATRSLALDPVLRAKMSKNARETAVKKFDHRKHAHALAKQIFTPPEM